MMKACDFFDVVCVYTKTKASEVRPRLLLAHYTVSAMYEDHFESPMFPAGQGSALGTGETSVQRSLFGTARMSKLMRGQRYIKSISLLR